MNHVNYLVESTAWNIRAVNSGNWNDPANWNLNRVPARGDNVLIPDSIDLLVQTRLQAPLASVAVLGSLSFDQNRDTQLILDTMLVGSAGRVTMGSTRNPLQDDREAHIIIQPDDVNAPLNVEMKTRGILVDGIFETNAGDKVSRARLAGDAMRDDNTVTFADTLEGWSVGDSVVVTATYYRPPVRQGRDQLSLPPVENELRSITAINGRTVTLDRPLEYDHVRATPEMSIYVGNLTRPISIRSANAEPVTDRGHMMVMENARVDMNDTGLYQLGRTRKDAPVSETNPIGVYSLHFHRNGYENRQTVNNSVIQGTPGWGLVNHSSHVDARSNVVHDFVGAAFVTEAGDELGSFVGNLASGGTNPPERTGKVAHREVVSSEQRTRYLNGDIGKYGMGFWLVGPAVEVQNNVVAGGRGTAYFYFGLGAYEDGMITGFPLSRFPDGVNPRSWSYNNQFTGEPMGLIPDMPIALFDDNTAYGVFQGVRIRWSNDDAGFLLWRNNRLSDEIRDSVVDSRSLNRRRTTLTNTTLWNVAAGFTVGYSGSFDVDGITIVNGDEYQVGCSPDNMICEEHGISLTNGMRGNDSKVTNARVGNINVPFDLGPTYGGSVTQSTVDGEPFSFSR